MPQSRHRKDEEEDERKRRSRRETEEEQEHEREHHPRRESEGEEEQERERRSRREEEEESGDDPKRHSEIIARRWQGSPRPTAERYARAREQWNSLPGALPSRSIDAGPDKQPNKPDREGPAQPGASEEETKP